jgi:hypothetical protein
VPVYEVLGRRGWDSRHNQTLVSAHRRGDTVESDIRSSCWEDGLVDMWKCGAHLSSSELEKKPKRARSELYYLWCK